MSFYVYRAYEDGVIEGTPRRCSLGVMNLNNLILNMQDELKNRRRQS